MEEKIKQLEQQIAELTAVNEALSAELSEKTAALEKASKGTSLTLAVLPTFQVGKKQYRVVYPAIRMSLGGELRTIPAEEIANNKELRELLVKDGSAAVQEV